MMPRQSSAHNLPTRLPSRAARRRRSVQVGFALLGFCGLAALVLLIRDQFAVRDLSVQVTDTTALFNWLTRDAAATQLAFGTTTGLGSIAGNGAENTTHSVDLTGLTADTLYYFQITGSGVTYRFRTTGGARQRVAFKSWGKEALAILIAWQLLWYGLRALIMIGIWNREPELSNKEKWWIAITVPIGILFAIWLGRGRLSQWIAAEEAREIEEFDGES